MARPLLLALALLLLPLPLPAHAGDGPAPPPGPVGQAVIDCAGDFAAVGISGSSTAWRLTIRAYLVALPSQGFDGGWRTWTYGGEGPAFARHGALLGVLALYHDIALEADGAEVARAACGFVPFEPLG